MEEEPSGGAVAAAAEAAGAGGAAGGTGGGGGGGGGGRGGATAIPDPASHDRTLSSLSSPARALSTLKCGSKSGARESRQKQRGAAGTLASRGSEKAAEPPPPPPPVAAAAPPPPPPPSLESVGSLATRSFESMQTP